MEVLAPYISHLDQDSLFEELASFTREEIAPQSAPLPTTNETASTLHGNLFLEWIPV